LAAIFGEIGEQNIHRLEARRVDHRAALAPDRDEPRLSQAIEMKGQRIGGELQGYGHTSSGHASWARFHKEAKDIEPVVLRESGQSRQSFGLFHTSIDIEIKPPVKYYFSEH
jgi:hypothetical protein